MIKKIEILFCTKNVYIYIYTKIEIYHYPLNKKWTNVQLYVCRCLVEMNTSASSAKELKKHKGT
jgi:hypothetical protein